MEENLSGTLAIDLGNTNTVIAFQDQKNNNREFLFKVLVWIYSKNFFLKSKQDSLKILNK